MSTIKERLLKRKSDNKDKDAHNKQLRTMVAGTKTGHTGSTKIALAKTGAVWEAFCNEQGVETPWSSAAFSDEILVDYVFFRLASMDELSMVHAGVPQIGTLKREWDTISLYAFTYHNVTINKALTKSFHGKLKVFLDMKLLSNEGRAKTVVSLYAMNEMIKHTTAIITIHDSVPYVVQSITACLLMFYTGVRPGSLVPTTASLASTWGYLTWGDVELSRSGKNADGHILFADVVFRHNKSTQYVDNLENRSFKRSISSPAQHADLIDLPLYLMVLASMRGVAVEDVGSWYKTDKALFSIKEEAKKLPVFCLYDDKKKDLTNNVAVGTNLANMVSRFFQKAGFESISPYAFRRHFQQLTARATDENTANLITNHAPGSKVQYKNYGNSMTDLDVTKLVLQGVVASNERSSLMVENQSFAHFHEQKLDATEKQVLYSNGLQHEMDSKNDFKKDLMKKHGLTKLPIDKMNDMELATWKSLEKAVISKKYHILKAAEKEKAAKINKQRRDNLTINDQGTVITDKPTLVSVRQRLSTKAIVIQTADDNIIDEGAINPSDNPGNDTDDNTEDNNEDGTEHGTENETDDETDDETEDVSQSSSAFRRNPIFDQLLYSSPVSASTTTTLTTISNDNRQMEIEKLHRLNGTIYGNVDCPFCMNDPTINRPKQHRGHTKLVKHMVSSMKSTDWSGPSVAARDGQHTNMMKWRRQAGLENSQTKRSTTCTFCDANLGVVTWPRYESHIMNNHPNQKSLTKPSAYTLIRQEVYDMHGIYISDAQMDFYL